MSFFEEFIESQMPEEAREALRKARQEQEEEIARAEMSGRVITASFDEFIRERDPNDVRLLELCIIKSTLGPSEAPYMLGQIHAVMKSRGYCTSCFKPITECLSEH